MKYMLMIYSDEALELAKSEEVLAAEMGQYMKFSDDTAKAGVFTAGEALHPTSTATSVRVQNGSVLTTDGPFAETKEHFGGFYLLDCKNLDEAIEWAAKIPHASQGVVEIRPVVDFSQMASEGANA